MPNFSEAQQAGLMFIEQMKDPFVREVSNAIFAANPPQLGEEAGQLADYCLVHHKKPDAYMEALLVCPDDFERLLLAVNTSHELLGVALLSPEELQLGLVVIIEQAEVWIRREKRIPLV